jgi:CubicO group peptidase (beta-lactamase class C family)
MFSPTVEIDGANRWGLGIAIEMLGDTPTYWHSGINPGFQSLFVIDPEQEKYVVVLTSSDDGLTFAKETAREYLGEDGVWDIPRGSYER